MKNHLLASFTALLSIPLLLTAQAQAADLSASSETPKLYFDDTNSAWIGDEFELFCQGNAGMETTHSCHFRDRENDEYMFAFNTQASLVEMGIGTFSPTEALHIATPQAPRILLDSANTDFLIGGPDDITFSIVANPGGISNVTGDIITLENDFGGVLGLYPGVGIWDSDPTVPLLVGSHDNQSAAVKVVNTGGSGTKVMFNLVNPGGVRFDMEDTSTGDNWVFQNQVGTFDITLAGTGTREFRFYPNGNLEISGSYLQASSRSIKHGVKAVDQQSVLEKVVALPINLWSYNREEGVRHMGPMSEDFYASFGLGGTDKGITTVDAGGVALAAIQGLKQEKDSELASLSAEKDAQIANLQAQLHQQEDRMMQLELALTEVLRNQSPEAQVGSAN